jgi:ribonucleoside-diphosphate reductase alpha chain
MDQIRSEALSFLGVADEATYDEMEGYYPKALNAYIDKGIELDILDPVLKTFDLEKMGAALDHTRDNQFTYLGLQEFLWIKLEARH